MSARDAVLAAIRARVKAEARSASPVHPSYDQHIAAALDEYARERAAARGLRHDD
jgi:hypothetical protein